MIYIPAFIILYLVGFYSTGWVATRKYRGESVYQFKRGVEADGYSHADGTLLAAFFWPFYLISIGIVFVICKGPMKLWQTVQMNALKPGDE